MMGPTCSEICILACLCMVAMFRPVFLQADVSARNDTSTVQKRWWWRGCAGCYSSINKLRTTVNSVSYAVQNNARQIQYAQNKVFGLEHRYASIQQQLRATSQQYATILRNCQNEMAAKVSSLETRLRTSSLQVGFSVKFSFDPVTNVPVHGVYKFNQIVTNVGNAYNMYTGMFTAPVSGLYALHFNFRSAPHTSAVQLVIQKEWSTAGTAWAKGRRYFPDQGSATALVFMHQGQRAWVEHSSGSTVIRGGPWAVFSGFLVQAQI